MELNQAKLDRIIGEAGFGGLESIALDAKTQVEGIKTAIDAIPEEKTVTINIVYNDEGYTAADAGSLGLDDVKVNYAQQPEDHDPVNDQSEYPPDVFS